MFLTWCFFHLTVIHDDDRFAIKGLCFPSQKKNNDCYKLRVDMEKEPLNIANAHCDCTIGLSGGCGHVCGLLYTFSGHQASGVQALPMDVAKTSQPRTWHVPRGNSIGGKAVQDLEVRSYSNIKSSNDQPSRGVKSTLMNPIRGCPPNAADLFGKMSAVHPKCMALDIMKNDHSPNVKTRFGEFPKGSPLSYQQSLSGEYVVNLMDNTAFPILPASDNMNNNLNIALSENQQTVIHSLTTTPAEAIYFEENTRLQSDTPLWYKVRKFRITASKFGEIAKRRKAEVTKFLERLKSTRHVQTAPMRDGLAREPEAAKVYSTYKEGKVNLYPCGCVVSCSAPWLAASPDRKVYDPSKQPPYGLLEIKCPEDSNVSGADWITVKNGQKSLKQNHNYFYQVLAQLAVTGLPWCDVFTWCYKDNSYYNETVVFSDHKDMWDNAKDKVDIFYFSHFIQ